MFDSKSWVPEVTNQYRLNATGNVIHIGTDIIGSILSILENFLAMALLELALLLSTFSRENTPPITGKMPVGSGDVRSLNHRNPSVSMAGQSTKL